MYGGYERGIPDERFERVANEIKGLEEEEEEGVGRTRSSDEKFRNTLLEIHPSNFFPE